MTEATAPAAVGRSAASVRRARRRRASRQAQASGAQRPHNGQYLKGCQCDWCAAYLERAREHGREGARRQLEHILGGKYGRCASCDDPVDGASLLCEFCSQPLSRITYSNCVICKKLFVIRGVRERKTCGRSGCQRKYRDIRVRNREHLKRSGVSDITAEQEMAMRSRTRKCRLCGVYMTSKAGRPNSKHLDHILPICQGGTHTHGNVRIICAACNLSRPKDGHDFAGQLTLWAQGPALVSRPRKAHPPRNTETCSNGLHGWIPENIYVTAEGKKRCRPCGTENSRRRRGTVSRLCKCGEEFAAVNQFAQMCPPCTDAATRKGAELHAGGLNWEQAAALVGYGGGWGLAYAAKRIGYIPAPRPAKPKPQRLCPGCGQPRPTLNHSPRGTPRPCETCTTAKAWRAVEMRTGGMTLRAIADHLGYDSITSVTNLMKTVAAVEQRMGRPRRDHVLAGAGH